jgi:Glycosyl transferase family 2
MRCPTLRELPPPPSGRTGWPWTIETTQLRPNRHDGSVRPRISIITPSYNQGQFIEETIRSVLLQGYPDLEYLVIDGGSRDQSVEVIRKYEPWLTYWVSEEDRGQSHAINKGFERTTGMLISWLNSDDVLLPDALRWVSLATKNLNKHILVAGYSEFRDALGAESLCIVDRLPSTVIDVFSFFSIYFAQPSVFITRKAFEEAGGVAENLYYAMDLDLWLRVAGQGCIKVVDRHLSWMRQHGQAKTLRDSFGAVVEVEEVLRLHAHRVPRAIAAKVFALARIERSCLWVRAGLKHFQNKDRSNAWFCAYRAVRTSLGVVLTRRWLGLTLRLTLPRCVRVIVFRASI